MTNDLNDCLFLIFGWQFFPYILMWLIVVLPNNWQPSWHRWQHSWFRWHFPESIDIAQSAMPCTFYIDTWHNLRRCLPLNSARHRRKTHQVSPWDTEGIRITHGRHPHHSRKASHWDAKSLRGGLPRRLYITQTSIISFDPEWCSTVLRDQQHSHFHLCSHHLPYIRLS